MPTVPASALSVSPIWSRCSQPGSAATSPCVNVWLPSSKPSRCSRRTTSGWRTTSLPTTKNVAGTWRRVSAAAMRGVQRGLGPSSNVSAIRLPGSASRDWSRPSLHARIGPWPESGPPLLGAGVALRPVVLVDRPWAPSRTSRVASSRPRTSQRERARREVVKSALLRRRWRWVESLPHLAGRGGRRCGRRRLADAPAVARRRRRSGRRLADLARRGLIVSPRPASSSLSRVHGCDRRRRSGLGRGVPRDLLLRGRALPRAGLGCELSVRGPRDLDRRCRGLHRQRARERSRVRRRRAHPRPARRTTRRGSP